MFESFTDGAIQVIRFAEEECRRGRYDYMGSEQILTGLILDDNSWAATILKELGLTLSSVRAEVEKSIGRGTSSVSPPAFPFTLEAKHLLERAVDESRKRNHDYIDPEHLLLGMIRDSESVASKVLQNLGIDLARVRTQVHHRITE